MNYDYERKFNDLVDKHLELAEKYVALSERYVDLIGRETIGYDFPTEIKIDEAGR